jgi:hypothetical protein
MRAWTGHEIEEERSRLETATATTLGFMIFEFSRLDMEVGWLLAWSNDGSALHELSQKFDGLNFNKRLEHLGKAIRSKYAASPEIMEAYEGWLARAHAVRALRNRLFHGRWAVEPIEQRVVNVVGLPNSPDKEITFYSIAELEDGLESMRALRTTLQELRSSWPA